MSASASRPVLRDVTLFHHPDAGEREWSAEHLLASLRSAGYEPAHCCMDDGDGEDWEHALAVTRRLAVVAGGDGTVGAIATRIPDRRVPIAILPTGSGNNIARSLGVFGDIGAIIPRLPRGETVPLRICRAEGAWGRRLFVEAVGLGALAHGTAELQHEKLDGDEKRDRGRASLVAALRELKSVPVSVVVDGRLHDGRDHLIVEAMNLPMIGANLRLLPDAPARDGLLTVAFLPADERDAMIGWIEGGAEGRCPMRYLRGRVVTMTGEPQPLRLEDKTIDWDGSEMSLCIEPGPVRVLGPRDAR